MQGGGDSRDGRPMLPRMLKAELREVPATGPARGQGARGFDPQMTVEVRGEGFNDTKYPELAPLVEQWGQKSAHARSASGRSVSYANAWHVYESALRSLPPRPTERAALAWAEALYAKGYGALSVRNVIRIMRRLYERARNRGASWANPFADLALPAHLARPRKKARLAVTDRNVAECFSRVYDALAGTDPWSVRDRALVAVLRFTGIRIGEALALEAQHVDLQRGRLFIEQQRDSSGKWTLYPYLKHDMQRRWLPIHPELAEELRRVLRLGPAHVRMGTAHQAGSEREVPFIFPHRSTQLETLNTKIVAVLRDVGYAGSGVRWHSWRHAFALEALLNTEPPVRLEEISKWLGHSSIAVTEKYLRELRGYETPATQLASLWRTQARKAPAESEGEPGQMFPRDRAHLAAVGIPFSEGNEGAETRDKTQRFFLGETAPDTSNISAGTPQGKPVARRPLTGRPRRRKQKQK